MIPGCYCVLNFLDTGFKITLSTVYVSKEGTQDRVWEKFIEPIKVEGVVGAVSE